MPNAYLNGVLQKYKSKDLTNHSLTLAYLKNDLKTWAATCFVDVLTSGSCAKGTAIALSSDVDLMVSLISTCNENAGGLAQCYESLYELLRDRGYTSLRRQNVSVRLKLNALEVDVTPARLMRGFQNRHNLYQSKTGTRKETDVKKHINDIKNSGRLDEIKLLKIWREKHQLDFPSIYLEYLVVTRLLLWKPKSNDALAANVFHCLEALAKETGHPLFAKVDDPANTNNTLSDLLNLKEKRAIILKAREAISAQNWGQIVS